MYRYKKEFFSGKKTGHEHGAIRKLINQRYKLLLSYYFQKPGYREDRKRYMTLRNEVNRAMRKAEAEHW